MPTRFESPYVRPLGDFCHIMGSEIPSICIRIALPKMRGFVIIWSMVIVEQFEGRKTTFYTQNQQLPARDNEKNPNSEVRPFDLPRGSAA